MRKIQIYSAASKICLPKVNVKRVSTKFLIKKFIVLAFALFCAEVLAQQGQPALEAALKEALPGAPMGHRLRIISALSREVSP